MEYYVTQPKDYWIASTAVNISLNALNEKNRIQGSVASGAVIMCFVEDIKAESEGGEPGNGDGLWYGANHEPKRWQLSLSPTYFNSDDRKFVYAAIPRSTSVGSQAVIVFPSEELDIYGRAIRLQGSEESYEQIGSTDYFYVYLHGIISAPQLNPSTNREERSWELAISDWGKLETAQGRDEKLNTTEWYSYSQVNQVVTFLKEIVMRDGSSFRNLILNSKNLTDVATSAAALPIDSDVMVSTPNYIEKFYLSKVHDDIAAGRITFNRGLEFLSTLLSIDSDGNKATKDFLNGRGIYMDADGGTIHADGGEFRGFLKIMELIINRLHLMESDYSFTEGDTTERVDWASGGQRMVLTMHKEHDNDHTPFYPGDILYAKINDLEDHGTYYTCWVQTVSVDLANNTITVKPYNGVKPNAAPMVLGGKNFTFVGTEITTDFTSALAADYTTYPDGYEKIINLTRHGNVADGLENGDDPTSYSASVLQSQQARQQAWVLSTSDKRLSFFWNVDEPIVRDENYAVCLGILPDLPNLPITRNPDMPSLYVNTLFADNIEQANYPARVVKTDRGQWVSNPTVIYDGDASGTWTPDGSTIIDGPKTYGLYVQTLGEVGVPQAVAIGDIIDEPYHYRTFTKDDWLAKRLSASWRNKSDAELERMMSVQSPKADLEASRVWNNGIIWECLVGGTSQEPIWDCTDWQAIGGDTVFYCEIESSAGTTFRNGNVDTVLTMSVQYGQEEITSRILQKPGATVQWLRKTGWDAVNRCFVQTAEDREWQATAGTAAGSIILERSDMGSGWMVDYRQAMFCCTIYAPEGRGTSAYTANFIQKA